MKPYNLDKKIFELLHEVSEGLQGKVPIRMKRRCKDSVKDFRELTREERREFYLNSGDTVQNNDFTIYAQQKRIEKENGQDELKDVPGIYDIGIWVNREDILN